MTTLIGPNAVTGISNRGSGSDIQSFIDFLGNPDTQIPLNSNFLVVFESTTILPTALLSPFPASLENGYWGVDSVKKALTSIVTLKTNNAPLGGHGCMFVQAFDVPGESVETSRPGVFENNTYGFLSGVVSGSRVKYGSTIDLGILETNKSFSEFVIRPWIALVGHYGLFTREESSSQCIKTNITGILFDKNNKNAIRKVYRFTGVAPVGMSTANYAYGSNEVRLDRVSFVFNSFGISDSYSKSVNGQSGPANLYRDLSTGLLAANGL
jgi:hypothetical protein